MTDIIMGLDIGGTKCSVCLADSRGELIAKEGFETKEALGPVQALENFKSIAHRLLRKNHVRLSSIGISCGSPLDPDKGIVQSPPNLPSWKDVPVVRIFEEEFGVPVFLDNDANAGACAEYLFGAGQGCRHMIFLTFGTGMGAGIIANGDIYRGANCYAGEVGHVRLADGGPIGWHKAGSFEGFCSGGGIAQVAKVRRSEWTKDTLLPLEPTARDVGESAERGDLLAIRILEETGARLGYGLAILIDILNPERIVIGSIFLRCEKFLRPSMTEVLKREALANTFHACEVVPAGLGEKIGDFAAVSVALLQMKKTEGR